MIDNFTQILHNNYLLGAIISFIVGALVAFSPCSLSKIPLVIAYVGNVKGKSVKTDFILSVIFTLGSAIIYTILGVVASLLGIGFLGNKIVYIILGLIMIIMSLQIGEIFNFIPTIDISDKNQQKGYFGAFIAGILGGVIVSPCATPFLVVILGVIAKEQNITYGVILMLMYSLGNGILTLIAGTSTGFVQRLGENKKYYVFDKIIKIILALILLAIGIYFMYLGF